MFHKFVAVGNEKTIYWDLTQPGFIAHQVLSTTGDTEIQNAQAAGFDYNPNLEKFVAWGDGVDVYILDFDSGI